MADLTKDQHDAWQAALFVQNYYSQSYPPELLLPTVEVDDEAPKPKPVAKKTT